MWLLQDTISDIRDLRVFSARYIQEDLFLFKLAHITTHIPAHKEAVCACKTGCSFFLLLLLQVLIHLEKSRRMNKIEDGISIQDARMPGCSGVAVAPLMLLRRFPPLNNFFIDSRRSLDSLQFLK